MAPKTIKSALSDILENLSKQDFGKFCQKLLDRKEEPRIRRGRVEDKNFLEVTNVLVSTFTEQGAVQVALEILRDIKCNEEAKELAEEMSGLSSKAGSSDTAGTPAGATGAANNIMADGEHFVDKHRTNLINRVSNIASILDQLLDKKVISQGKYDEILAISTCQDQMRKLYSGPLNSAGNVGKDSFLKILEKEHPLLIDELKKKK